MRTIPLLLMVLAVGCTSPGTVSDGRGHNLPAEAVRNYADAHRISRREAARELGLLQDSNYLQELRTKPPQASEPTPPETKAAPETSSLTTP